jgi:ABC-type transporter Mla maintaining outer membrane lipid asymmetry permease subunit MlaE
MKRRILNHLQLMGEVTDLFMDFIRCTFSRPFYLARLYEQIVQLGIGSLSITLVIGIVTGMVMTLQFGYGLESLAALFMFRRLFHSL